MTAVFSAPVTLTLDYSEKDFTLRLDFVQEGASGPILDNLPEDCLSLMLVRGMCSSGTEPAPGRIQVEM